MIHIFKNSIVSPYRITYQSKTSIVTPRQTNLDYCLADIMDAGYCAECFLLNACWYGLPQSRNRVYIICLNVQHPAVSVNAKDFFANVRLLLQKLYLKAPAVESCLFWKAFVLQFVLLVLNRVSIFLLHFNTVHSST